MTPNDTHQADKASRRPLRRAALIGGGVALFAAGAIASALIVGRRAEPQHEAPVAQETGAPSSEAMSAAFPEGPLPDVTIPVAADLAARAGIEVAAATTGVMSGRLRLPGTVQPNEYQQVVVSPLVGGRVTSVSVQLGDKVTRGAPLARIFSSDLASAQAAYASARAELRAAEQRVARTSRLVEIGAASRQELEADEAQRARLAAEVQGAGARLRELGLSPQRIASTASPSAGAATITVPAPITGVVTARKANIGLVVDPSSELFTVASLSPVWIIADVQEADLSRVRVGTMASVEADVLPGKPITGKVSYISPDLRPETRTAQVRVEVPNPAGDLRFGMFVNVELIAPGPAGGVVVPREAVQAIGSRHFVYVVPPGRTGEYVEREVTVGTREAEDVEILTGLRAGETVVAKGSFMVRAERERLGLRQGVVPPRGSEIATASSTPGEVVKVIVSETGFKPARIAAGKGSRVRLEFTRVSEKTCGTEIVVPSQQIREDLPLNTPVTVEVSAAKTGEIVFFCGMSMLRGAVVVQ